MEEVEYGMEEVEYGMEEEERDEEGKETVGEVARSEYRG